MIVREGATKVKVDNYYVYVNQHENRKRLLLQQFLTKMNWLHFVLESTVVRSLSLTKNCY